MCLLDILNRFSKELGISLVAAHFNHGLRVDEDELETQLAKDVSASIAIPFETETASSLLKNCSSLEEHARDSRYAFLEKIRNKYGAQKIAMGHNLNDQAETVLMRLLRGSGPSGLAGIPPVRDNIIIRPLIEITRNEIITYLNAGGLAFAVDSSNSNEKYLRNRIRLELIPAMLDYQPRFLEHLGIFSNIIRDEDAFIESMASEWIERESKKTDHGDISAAVLSIQQLPDPLKNRVIRGLIKKVRGDIYPVEYDHIISVSRLLNNEQPQCSVDLPNGITVKKTYESLHFMLKSRNDKIEYSYFLKGPGIYELDVVGQTLTLEEIHTGADVSLKGDLSTVFLDAEKIQYPLIARNFRPGDRFVPLGMAGHKKVKNYFIDLKVPSEKRGLTPMLASGDKIVWVCGYRIDDRFKVTPQTKRILKVTINQ